MFSAMHCVLSLSLSPVDGMIISLIAAMAKNRVIGRENSMPWNIPSDRRRFRTITWGHPVLFGRKTIAGLAQDRKADAIVMGSRGLSDIKGLFLGSVSHKVSHLAECTCITVK